MWQNFAGGVMDRIYDVITFISIYLSLRKGWGRAFADILKVSTMFIITIYKDSRKVKINRNHVSKYNLLSVFLDIVKFANFRWKNADVSRIQGVCHVIHIFFGSSLGKV